MIAIDHVKIDSQTIEGRKALRLMTINTASIVSALGLPPQGERPVYSKAALCLMAVAAGLSPKDFHHRHH
ncbi:TPA: hypothetical protein MH439_02030 [Klebsiella pneumoniae]|nr:hypothetical protein CHR63_06040 [Serratia marcescens]HBX5401528.1 hypothetical protein [Klebsiella pneumoniae]